MGDGAMKSSFLFQELKTGGFDLQRLPQNYFAGGMEDPCRIEPDSVLVFFTTSRHVRRNMRWCDRRYQLKFNLGRTAFLGIDELNFQLGPDSGILIFPFQLHYVNLDVPYESRYYMTVTFLDRGNGRDSILPLMNQPFSVEPEDVLLLKKIVGAYQQLPGYEAGEALGCLRIFLSRKLCQIRHQSRHDIPVRSPFLERLLACIREHYDQPLSIKTLAEMLGLSESHLRRLVREQLGGISLGTFLHRLRFQHSYELIQRTDLPMREIAVKCGYSDIFSFSRAFKRDAGFSPTEFRKRCREKAR